MYYAIYEMSVLWYGARQIVCCAKQFESELEADEWLHKQVDIRRIGVTKLLPPF